jgi:hypothetical protein
VKWFNGAARMGIVTASEPLAKKERSETIEPKAI